MSATVYLVYDAEDVLLYVGATMYGPARLDNHKSKSWWMLAARAEFRHFATTREALEEEERLIRELHPRHNITGRVFTREEREERLATRRANLAALDERARARGLLA